MGEAAKDHNLSRIRPRDKPKVCCGSNALRCLRRLSIQRRQWKGRRRATGLVCFTACSLLLYRTTFRRYLRSDNLSMMYGIAAHTASQPLSMNCHNPRHLRQATRRYHRAALSHHIDSLLRWVKQMLLSWTTQRIDLGLQEAPFHNYIALKRRALELGGAMLP